MQYTFVWNNEDSGDQFWIICEHLICLWANMKFIATKTCICPYVSCWMVNTELATMYSSSLLYIPERLRDQTELSICHQWYQNVWLLLLLLFFMPCDIQRKSAMYYHFPTTAVDPIQHGTGRDCCSFNNQEKGNSNDKNKPDLPKFLLLYIN